MKILSVLISIAIAWDEEFKNSENFQVFINQNGISGEVFINKTSQGTFDTFSSLIKENLPLKHCQCCCIVYVIMTEEDKMCEIV